MQRRPAVFRTLFYRRTERCRPLSSTPFSTATNTVCDKWRLELKKLDRAAQHLTLTYKTHLLHSSVWLELPLGHIFTDITHIMVFMPLCELHTKSLTLILPLRLLCLTVKFAAAIIFYIYVHLCCLKKSRSQFTGHIYYYYKI